MATLIILTLHILRECHIYIYTIYVHIIAFFSNPITITAHSFNFKFTFLGRFLCVKHVFTTLKAHTEIVLQCGIKTFFFS